VFILNQQIHKCRNHPERKAHNICHNCKSYFCSDCLDEGAIFYYCKEEECQLKLNEEIYYSTNPVFCPKCMEDTTSETTNNLVSINGFGFVLGGKSNICPICNSYIQNKYFALFFIPIFKIGEYRIKNISVNYKISGSNKQFISRKVKKPKE